MRRIQVSAYRHALDTEYPGVKTAILQVGYARNKRGWKFNEVDDQYHLFKAAREIWKNECLGETPKQVEYPLEISLGISEADGGDQDG